MLFFNCGEFNDLEKELIKVLASKNIKYYSCIKELNISNYKFLFMGDAGVEKENDILEKYNLKNIDFLKIGHHGSRTSSSKEFINEINPKYSLISVGKITSMVIQKILY